MPSADYYEYVRKGTDAYSVPFPTPFIAKNPDLNNNPVK